MDRSSINHFCFSRLWTSQYVSQQPKAVNEQDFIVPGTGATVSSAEGRRNLTDVQETSQWLGGIEVPEMILADLCFLAKVLEVAYRSSLFCSAWIPIICTSTLTGFPWCIFFSHAWFLLIKVLMLDLEVTPTQHWW